ncbi:MAG: LD-carboxypeptidase [Rubrivivax sp.]
MTSLTVFSPSGVVAEPAALRLALRRLVALGFEARLDEDALARRQRFAGDDARRLAALHRVADASPSVALASRGGYGLTRLLDGIEWPRLARSIERGTRWVGYSDFTALHLGLLAHLGAASWAGPTALGAFSADTPDEVTLECFREAMSGELEALGFRTEPGLDGLERRGVLWGGNLTMVCALLGTPHFPRVSGGILFLEDVNEHPYETERRLLQLHQAGVIAAQSAVILGHFTAWKPSPLDRGYGMKSAVQALRSRTDTPVLTGLPFGHVPTQVTLPVGREVMLAVEGRGAFLAW